MSDDDYNNFTLFIQDDNGFLVTVNIDDSVAATPSIFVYRLSHRE